LRLALLMTFIFPVGIRLQLLDVRFIFIGNTTDKLDLCVPNRARLMLPPFFHPFFDMVVRDLGIVIWSTIDMIALIANEGVNSLLYAIVRAKPVRTCAYAAVRIHGLDARIKCPSGR